MIKRKLTEVGSALYRSLVFPFQRIIIELKTKSILKQGSYINKGTVIAGRNYIGKKTVLSNVYVGYGSMVSDGGDLSNTRIGKYSSIGPEAITVLGRHPVDERVALHPAFYSEKKDMGYTYLTEGRRGDFEEQIYIDSKKGIQIDIGNDVWIGRGVMLIEGVTIGDGAVIGTGSVVTKDIEPYGVYAGVPAKKLRDRFDEDTKKKLLELKWWDWDESVIKSRIDDFRDVRRILR
ncbi:MAG TPA: acetyltransferase [Lachnospiraceae bacterium]|nr:acetyltransferase [Lachnospiraceae bacterium]